MTLINLKGTKTMAIGRIIMQMNKKYVKQVIKCKIIIYYDNGYIAECILCDSAENAICRYLTPFYKKGKNLNTKALNSAKMILCNLISGYEFYKNLPIEIIDTTI
jgi:hypothetical protein